MRLPKWFQKGRTFQSPREQSSAHLQRVKDFGSRESRKAQHKKMLWFVEVHVISSAVNHWIFEIACKPISTSERFWDCMRSWTLVSSQKKELKTWQKPPPTHHQKPAKTTSKPPKQNTSKNRQQRPRIVPLWFVTTSSTPPRATSRAVAVRGGAMRRSTISTIDRRKKKIRLERGGVSGFSGGEPVFYFFCFCPSIFCISVGFFLWFFFT